MRNYLLHALAALVILFGTRLYGQANAPLPAIKTADFDQQGRFRVNGQPFFPIVLYDAPTDEKTLRQLRGFGFNVLACAPQVCDMLPARGFYGAVHADKKL